MITNLKKLYNPIITFRKGIYLCKFPTLNTVTKSAINYQYKK